MTHFTEEFLKEHKMSYNSLLAIYSSYHIDAMERYAEAYLKHEVEAITDEVYDILCFYGIDEPKASEIFNDIKNKLLKQ